MNLDNYKANLQVFSETLQSLAEGDKEIVVTTSDSRGSGKLVPFAERFPEQIIEVGIAEQNLVGVSAGLASCRKKVFATSPACFLTARSLEQVKNDVAYSDNPVNLIGISAGVSYGTLGSTHHSLHDYAALRAINNIIVVAPADNWETEQAIRLAAVTPQPVYLRFGKKAMPFLKDDPKEVFEFGKGRIIREGEDVLIIGCGETVYPALEASEILRQEHGISATVVSMPTIKPLDTELLNALALRHRAVITVEEHSVNGGLGEACASFLIQSGICVPFRIMGIPDEYTITGSQTEIFEYYGLSKEGITKVALELSKKNTQ